MAELTLRYGYADTPLGQLHYAESGAGQPVILLHQTPRSLDEFAEVQPLLAAHRRVIAMDMYGFGQSAKFPASVDVVEIEGGMIPLMEQKAAEVAEAVETFLVRVIGESRESRGATCSGLRCPGGPC